MNQLKYFLPVEQFILDLITPQLQTSTILLVFHIIGQRKVADAYEMEGK